MARYRSYLNPITHSRVKRRTHKRGLLGDMGADVDVMRKGLTASIDAVKAVGVTAIIAAGGAVATNVIFKQIGPYLKLTAGSVEENLAKAVTGIAGGIVIGKFLKKPQLGAAFAIGAVTFALYNILVKQMPSLATFGYTSIERKGFHPAPLALSATSIQPQGFRPQMPQVAGYGAY